MGFGQGFTQGVQGGIRLSNAYKAKKEKEIENQLFKTYAELQQDRQMVDEEGNQIVQEAMDFSNMSGDEITNSILREVSTAGGKIDDQTYGIAYKMGSLFQEKKDKAALFQQKERSLDLREESLHTSIFTRSNAEERRREKYELQKQGKWNPSGKKGSNVDGYDVPLGEDGKPDYKSIKVGSKLFKDLSSDGKNEVRKAHGLKGSYTPPKSRGGGSIFDDEPTSETQTKKFRNKKTGDIDTFEKVDGKWIKI